MSTEFGDYWRAHCFGVSKPSNTESCGGVEGHAPTCRADIDPAVNRREGRLQQGPEAGLKPSPHDLMTDLVEIGVEAIRDCIRANDMREASYVRAFITAIEKAGHRIVPVEITPEMRQAGLLTDTMDGWDGPETCWEWMLAAAPKVAP